MPRLISIDDDRQTGLEECVADLERSGLDPRDEESFVAVAPILKRLANDRRFLADRAIASLKTRCRAERQGNGYGAQVIMLHRGPGYFIRANFWPSPRDSVVKASGTAPFFYGVPHDHNFSFLTVGYLGPGYWSDYYECDYTAVAGYPGETANLRFIERARLEEGKLMLYRAHRDVHLQLPADSMSVSLNIAESSQSLAWRDQYRFDVDQDRIVGILNQSPLEPLLALAAQFGGEDGRDLLDQTALRHPSERARFHAIAALAAAAPDAAGREALLEQGTRDGSRLVAGLCAARLRQGGN